MDTQPTRARTIPFQSSANRIVRVLLRTPVLAPVVGGRLLVIDVVGRKTGRRFAVPVAYARHEGHLLVGTQFPWVRNLRTGEPVEILLRGRRRTAEVTVVADEAGVVADYAVLARGNRQFAALNGVRLDAAGEPAPTDLHACWAAGARTVHLTPR